MDQNLPIKKRQCDKAGIVKFVNVWHCLDPITDMEDWRVYQICLELCDNNLKYLDTEITNFDDVYRWMLEYREELREKEGYYEAEDENEYS